MLGRVSCGIQGSLPFSRQPYISHLSYHTLAGSADIGSPSLQPQALIVHNLLTSSNRKYVFDEPAHTSHVLALVSGEPSFGKAGKLKSHTYRGWRKSCTTPMSTNWTMNHPAPHPLFKIGATTSGGGARFPSFAHWPFALSLPN